MYKKLMLENMFCYMCLHCATLLYPTTATLRFVSARIEDWVLSSRAIVCSHDLQKSEGVIDIVPHEKHVCSGLQNFPAIHMRNHISQLPLTHAEDRPPPYREH